MDQQTIWIQTVSRISRWARTNCHGEKNLSHCETKSLLYDRAKRSYPALPESKGVHHIIMTEYELPVCRLRLHSSNMSSHIEYSYHSSCVCSFWQAKTYLIALQDSPVANSFEKPVLLGRENTYSATEQKSNVFLLGTFCVSSAGGAH